MRILAEYCDYEDSDTERISEMEVLVATIGGRVTGRQASEEDGVAYIGAVIPDEKYDEFKVESEEIGWEVAKR